MIIILMGVSGSGKTTVGKRLAGRLDWPFYDGDDFHPQANIDKMARGEPLTDADRWPWLDAIHAHMVDLIEQGQSAVIAASALKRVYRERLRGALFDAIQFVYLKGSYDLIHRRMTDRPDHFFDADLLRSQFNALQEPASDAALIVPVDQPVDAVTDAIIEQLALG